MDVVIRDSGHLTFLYFCDLSIRKYYKATYVMFSAKSVNSRTPSITRRCAKNCHFRLNAPSCQKIFEQVSKKLLSNIFERKRRSMKQFKNPKFRQMQTRSNLWVEKKLVDCVHQINHYIVQPVWRNFAKLSLIIFLRSTLGIWSLLINRCIISNVNSG